jgi:hypothetical protein
MKVRSCTTVITPSCTTSHLITSRVHTRLYIPPPPPPPILRQRKKVIMKSLAEKITFPRKKIVQEHWLIVLQS